MASIDGREFRTFKYIKQKPLRDCHGFNKHFGRNPNKQADLEKLAERIIGGPDWRTLRKLIRGEPTSIEVSKLTRVLNYFELELSELYEWVESSFWKDMQAAGICQMSRMNTAASGGSGDSDEEASLELSRFIKDRVGDLKIKKDDDPHHQADALLDPPNAFSFGSPQWNDDSERLICEAFGAEPFNDSPENCHKIPFYFRHRRGQGERKKSAVFEVTDKDDQLGIINRSGKPLVTTSWIPDLLNQNVDEHPEAGLIVVAPRRHAPSSKLVVLAGVSGPGTIAATRMLFHSSHEFDVIERALWGVIRTSWAHQKGERDGRKPSDECPKWVRAPGP